MRLYLTPPCCRLPGSLVTEGERKRERTLDASDASGEPACTTCKTFIPQCLSHGVPVLTFSRTWELHVG